MDSKPPVKLSELLREMDALTPAERERMRDRLKELGEDYLGAAYRELVELVGADDALDRLFDGMLGPIVLEDGTEIPRWRLGKPPSKRLH